MASEESAGACTFIYLLLNGVFFLFVAIYCDVWTDEASDNSTYPTGFMN
jgi:hypothetical protein